MSENTIVRVTVNKKTGKMDIKVVGHENTSCSLADDHDIISKIASNIGKITDEDNTEEYYDEKYGTEVSSGYNSGNDDGEEKKKEEKIGLGFGV